VRLALRTQAIFARDFREEQAMSDTAGRAEALQAIQAKFEKTLPNPQIRAEVEALFARAIEIADEERSDGWFVSDGRAFPVLQVRRLRALSVRHGRIELSVLGPIDAALRAELGAEERENEEWKAIPGGLQLFIPVASAALVRARLEEPFARFVATAMQHLRRSVSLEAHSADAVAYLSSVVGRELPQPGSSRAEDEPDATEEPERMVPRVRGRAPLFINQQISVSNLIGMIEQGTMALPDLQRPFVWEDTKVRDLLDSLFVGFPVGNLVLWQVSEGMDARIVGGIDTLRVTTLIIDGQQRLTSLFAVMRGVPITDRDGSKRRITVAFRPRDGHFEVSDAAIQKDPEYLQDVRELWDNKRTKSKMAREIFAALKEKGREVSDEYESAVEENLDRAQAIANYTFPVVTLQKAAGPDDTSEEDIAEIFVRINNQGKRLGHADFVLTLLSVFHGALRDRIEHRSVEMSRESVIEIDAQQLLRITCAVGFHRAKMSSIYRFLRGVDPSGGDTSSDARRSRLVALEQAAEECLNRTHWRDFTLRVVHAGFVSDALIASNNAILNAYSLYVLGRRVGVSKPRLDELISRWIFATLLSARYSSSSETRFEEDLGRVASVRPGDADGFVDALDKALSDVLSGDFWTSRLVHDLETQRSHAPAALAFRAAQIVLGSKALFGDQAMRDMLDPHGSGDRAAIEIHHLFPQAWLGSLKIRDRRKINQVANLADVGWYENAVIGGRAPASYVPRIREKLSIDDDRWGRACAEHALPLGWETLDYETFLVERRKRMAEIIRVAYRKLGGEKDAAPLAPPWFLAGAEAVWTRIGATERLLRSLVRELYASLFEGNAAQKIRDTFSGAEREGLERALRSRPAGADPLSIVDYLYLGQLPRLLFASEVWQVARTRISAQDAKSKLQGAIDVIAPVRNEIAHVREVNPEQLQRANLACSDIQAMLGAPR
jgi:hypothetical protein